MNRLNPAAGYPTDALFKGMKSLLTSLPTEAEKQELLQTLEGAQGFLEELRRLVETAPTMESSQELAEGLSRLDILMARAHQDAGLRRLLGLRAPKLPGAKNAAAPGDAAERAARLAETLTRLPTGEVMPTLAAEPLAVLTELAVNFGMRPRSKERKADLVKRIMTHIENQRGYSLLRGNNPAADSNAPSSKYRV